MKKIRIALADDQHLFRKGLISLLNEEDAFKIVIEAENGRVLIDRLKSVNADVLLLDLEMPVMSGTEALDIIKIRFPELKVLVLTMHDDEAFITELIGKGVNGFLIKDNSIDTLVDAIFAVHEKDYYFTPRVTAVMSNATNKSTVKLRTNSTIDFTKREIEILSLICHEYSTKEIAEKLIMGERTVEWHRSNIIQKTNSKNTAGIVFYAVKNGLVN
ncbi:MAG: response regulator transcription factor [Bacteroidetes bacterium]|nr:response regulator transcription factor [Bacteroidota bacterium]MBK9800881.1 response regulator transcription factor [Bacteroidota bacterium]MBP6412025.1 response regulator transcription factor [Bacteroidia bacterium]